MSFLHKDGWAVYNCQSNYYLIETADHKFHITMEFSFATLFRSKFQAEGAISRFRRDHFPNEPSYRDFVLLTPNEVMVKRIMDI